MASAIHAHFRIVLSLAAMMMSQTVSAQTPSPTLPPGTNAQVESLLQGAFKLEWANKTAEADADYRKAIDIAEKIKDPAERGELPRALDWQAAFFRHLKKYPEATTAADRALSLYEERFGKDDPRNDHMRVSLGGTASASGDYAKSEPFFRTALAAYDRDPSKAREPNAAAAALGLAFALDKLSKPVEAAAIQKKGIEIKEKVSPKDNRGLAFAYLSLGRMYGALRQREYAGQAFEAATKAAAQFHGDDAQIVMAAMLLSQAAFFRDLSRYVDARSNAEQALALRETKLGRDDPAVDEVHIILGQIAVLEKDRPKADGEFMAALEGYRHKSWKEAARWAAYAARELAGSLQSSKKYQDAEKIILEGIAARETLPDDKVNLAKDYQLLALIYGDQRKFNESETAFRKAISIQTAAPGGKPGDLAYLYRGLGDICFEAGRYRESEEPYLKAIPLLSERDEDWLALSAVQSRLSATYRVLRRFPEAEDMARKTLAARQKRMDPENPLIADGLFQLAAAFRGEGRNALAEPLYRRAMTIREKNYGPDNAQVLSDKNSLALALDGMGRPAEAEPLFREALAGREKRFGRDDETVADTYVGLTWLLYRQGRLDEAAQIAERPLAIYRKTLGPNHPSVVRGLLPLAAIHQSRSEFDEADALYRDALRIRMAVFGATDTSVADSFGDLVRLSIARRQYEEATGYMSKRLNIYESRMGADDPRLIRPLADLENLQTFTRDFDGAEATGRRVLAIAERTYGPDSLLVALASTDMARVYRLKGKFGNVESFYERPLAIYRKVLGEKHPFIAVALNLVAEFRIGLGQTKDAEALYDESIAILTAAYGKDSPALSGTLNDKALLLLQTKRGGEAEALFKRAIELLRKGSSKPTVALAAELVNLSFVYASLGRQVEADKLREEAVAIYTKLLGPNRLPPLAPAAIVPPRDPDET
jgi:tetratricopeptide (TPR) repeat protein